MTKTIRAAAGRVADSFVQGIAQMGTLTMSERRKPAPRKTAAEALRGDWARLGGDMERAVRKVKERESAQ
ncbi:MAG: hypothetical protein EWM45_07810 [Rhodopseudomonas palustris]|uniref:hypothetical protein n=1 Tax=Rhodopseudomonas faecalis TaxID=99655 RepID=UPI0011B46AC4|nr:hypothetical protein [Rhodopseudomonas faecalis]TAH67436.1 MAG: hypothetical protein EWM45_07810 [Rhodopseudomonas palustris]